jgi:hypothetical protein
MSMLLLGVGIGVKTLDSSIYIAVLNHSRKNTASNSMHCYIKHMDIASYLLCPNIP